MPRTKPIIAVDIDDTLVPHFQDLVDWYNGEYGTSLTLADNHPKSVDGWGTTEEAEAIRRVQRFFTTDQFLHMKPHEEAVDAITRLSTQYGLVIVTSRDTIVESATHRMLQSHFEDIFQGVHFTAFYSLEGKRRSKADVCAEVGAGYLIDDAIDACEAAAANGIEAILFGNYPWNKADTLPVRVTRCKDWAAVLEYFDGR